MSDTNSNLLINTRNFCLLCIAKCCGADKRQTGMEGDCSVFNTGTQPVNLKILKSVINLDYPKVWEKTIGTSVTTLDFEDVSVKLCNDCSELISSVSTDWQQMKELQIKLAGSLERLQDKVEATKLHERKYDNFVECMIEDGESLSQVMLANNLRLAIGAQSGQTSKKYKAIFASHDVSLEDQGDAFHENFHPTDNENNVMELPSNENPISQIPEDSISEDIKLFILSSNDEMDGDENESDASPNNCISTMSPGPPSADCSATTSLAKKKQADETTADKTNSKNKISSTAGAATKNKGKCPNTSGKQTAENIDSSSQPQEGNESHAESSSMEGFKSSARQPTRSPLSGKIKVEERESESNDPELPIHSEENAGVSYEFRRVQRAKRGGGRNKSFRPYSKSGYR